MWGVAAALGGAQFLQGVGNYFLQKENLDWQKSAQQTTWQREDTAVQRRAKDLEAAGLSKTLAAGGSAQTSGPISTTAPQFEGVGGGIDKAAMALNLMRQKAEIAKTYADTEAIKLQGQLAIDQAAKTRQDTSASAQLTPLNVARVAQEIKNMGVDNARKEVEVQASKVGLDQAKVDLVKSAISADVASKTQLRGAELDLIAKKLAIEIDQTARDKAWYDFGIYKSLGYPTGTNLGTIDKAGILTGTALGTILKKGLEYKPENRGNVPPWAEKAIRGGR